MTTYMYFDRFPDDRKLWKWLVWAILLANTLDTVFIAASAYWRLIEEYGNVLASVQLDWRSQAHLPLLAIISLLTQLWFCQRLFYLFNRKLYLPCAIFMCSV
jgi:hypothetical protein